MTTSQTTGKNSETGADRRGRFYLLSGHLLVSGFVIVFLAFMVRNYYQNTLWTDYYFKNAHKFGETCSARFSGSDRLEFPRDLAGAPLTPVVLPHSRGFFDSWSQSTGPYYHAEYQCLIDTVSVRIGKGANYIHLGWLFGERIEVLLNGKTLLTIHAEDFVSLPLGQDELSAPGLEITVRVSSTDRHRFGFASLIPPAITTETKDHLSILGIQPVYEFLNNVQPMIPTMALSILIGLAWFIGIRTRIVLTGMFYFAVELSGDVLALAGPYLPVSATKVYTLGLPLGYLKHVVVLCLIFEIFGVWRTRIYNIMNCALVAATVAFLWLLSWGGVFPYSQLLNQILDPVVALLFTMMFLYWLKERTHVRAAGHTSQQKILNGAAAFLVAVILIRLGFDIARHFAWTSQLSLNFYFRFFIQLFVAGLVLFYLSSVETDLLQKKKENKFLRQRLSVGSDLMDIVHSGQIKVQSQVALLTWKDVPDTGIWRAAWTTADGDLVIIQGSVVGTGDQMSAGVIAIQTVLELCRCDRIGNPRDCFEMVNKSIVGLFKKFLRSTATAVVVHPDLSIDIYEAGGRGVFLSGAKEVLSPGGQPLGSSDFIQVADQSALMVGGQTLYFVGPEDLLSDFQSDLPLGTRGSVVITAA